MKMRNWLMVLSAMVGLCSMGASVDSLLQEAALWLDASNPQNFEFNAEGGVKKWINGSAAGREAYGDAVAGNQYLTGVNLRHGGLSFANGVPVLDFQGTGSKVDYSYSRISTIRTVFIVGGFVNNDSLTPLLGDTSYRDFHRGKSGYVWNKGWAQGTGGYGGQPTFYINSATQTCNADATAPTANALNIITIECPLNAHSNCLTEDRNFTDRTGGRTLAEVLVFTRALSATERTEVYNYLNAKWKNNGWDTGIYNALAATQTYSDDQTVQSGKVNLFPPATTVSVASGKTATFADFTSGSVLTFNGGGTLDFADGSSFAGAFTQAGGTLDFGGGAFDVSANPALSGAVTWKNGTLRMSFAGEFRPPANTTLTMGEGARVVKDGAYRTFFDRGNVTLNLDSGSVFDVPGPFNVSIDSATKNYLNLNGGTLVVTNASDSSAFHNRAVTIGSQSAASGSTVAEGFMTMTSGRLLAGKLRCAAAWNAAGNTVKAKGTITVGGGSIELLDCLELGTSSGTRGLATVVLNGGEITSQNGVVMYADDIDVLTLNGVTFKAPADKANYFDLKKGNGANTTIGDNGFGFEVAAGKTVGIGWGLKGTGGITKRGAGTLVLDKSASFTGGLVVEAGVAKLAAANAAGTGAVQLAEGATLEVSALNQPNTLVANAACTIRVVCPSSGKLLVMNVANDFALAGKTLKAVDPQGVELPTATFTVEGGKLYCEPPSAYTAALADGTNSEWYTLAWQQGGAAAAFPTTAGMAMEAILTAAGTSTVSLGSDVHAGTVTYVNDGDGAVTTLTGPKTLDAALNLTGYNGEFRLNQVPVTGTIAYGSQPSPILWANAGQEWSVPAYAFSGTANLRTGGAGTVVWPEFPTRTIEVTSGIFAFPVTANSTTTPSLTGAGAKEKRGAGTLQFNGGTFAGPWRVTEGTLVVNCDFRSAGKSLYVGPGATLRIPHASQVNNRLPSGAQVVVDGGTFEAGGVNPFADSGANLAFSVTDGTFSILNTSGAEHIKFQYLTLKDSTFVIKGDKTAYQNNAIYMNPSPCTITSEGAVDMKFEAANCPNSIQAAADITLAVNSGTNLFALSTLRTINKKGAGMIRFPTAVKNNSSAYVNVNEGKVGGGQIKYLGLAANTTIVPDMESPLTITVGLNLPASGTVTIDAKGIDFANRTEDVVVLRYGSMKTADAAKFTVDGLPSDWKVAISEGVILRKSSAPKALTWNTGSGNWSASEWNHEALGFVDGYHTVTLADTENGTPGEAATINVSGARAVESFSMTSTQTPYVFTGSGSVRMPSFAPGGTSGFTFGVPLYLDSGNITFQTTTADQEIAAIRGTIGTVNVPAAAGGKAVLGFMDGSPNNPGAVTIGAGKTLEFRNNYATSASIKPGAITADATAKLIVTGPRGAFHTDILQNCPNMKCQVEVTDRGFLYIAAQFNQVVATQANPVWVHGEGSILRYFGSQTQNRFPNNGWIKVTDGGTFVPTGVNPTVQRESPNIVLSNGVTQVESSSGSTVHTKEVYLQGNSTFALTGTAQAYSHDGKPEGVVIHGGVHVLDGSSVFTRTAGPNFAHFTDSAHNKASGVFEVAANAKLTLSCPLVRVPVKTGAGSIEIAGDFCSGATKSITVNGGYIVANTNANALTSLTMATGTGFDLTVAESCYTPTDIAALVEPNDGLLYLKTGDRELELDEYLVRWPAGSAPNCRFRFASGEANGKRYILQRMDDGVKVGRNTFVIMVR